jgi:hypothetical protein
MSFILPKDELTLAEMRKFRDEAASAGLRRAVRLGIAGSEQELCLRQALNIVDFGAALEQWNTAALAVVGTPYSCFQAIAAPTLAANKLAVFYGVAITTAPVPVSRLTFRAGGAAGNILAGRAHRATDRVEANTFAGRARLTGPPGCTSLNLKEGGG